MASIRQLAAIMFTDIVGYTALMGKDSKKAIELVRQSKEIQKPLVEKHHGKWIKEMGDGAMAQFNTALDAVNCAVEIQRTSRADFEEDIRIGIHLGDITIENDDVYGDGVNVASRLESIADPGGIYISESIEKAMRGQHDIQAKYLGEVKLKNVDYDVRTYALQGVGLPVPAIGEDKELTGQFWAELERRGVIRAGGTYVVISLLLLMSVPYANEVVSLPEWTTKALLAVVAAGFPIAIYMAWSFERSPEGFVRTTSSKSWQNPYSAAQRKPLTGRFVIAGLLLVIVVMYLYPHSSEKQSPNNILSTSSNSSNEKAKSIAILPFRNLSSDPAQVYFAEGVAEMIRSNLSKVADLRVISMRSVMQYANSEKTIPQIGSELNVGKVLEGSVLKEGNQVRVIVQLIDAPNDKHLWSETYDQDLTGIFEIQTRIAQKIVQELQAHLTPEENKRVSEAGEVNMEAYQLFLSGSHNLQEYYKNRDSVLNESAISKFKQAITINPAYAQAWSWLGQAYRYRPQYGRGDRWFDSAYQRAQVAIELDANQSVSYYVMGRIQQIRREDEEAIKNFEKAIALNPNYAEARHRAGLVHLGNKNYKKGLSLIAKSLQLDPVIQRDDFYYTTLANLYLWAGLNEKAEEFLRKQIAINPSQDNYEALNFSLWQLGKWDEAKKNLSKFEKDYDQKDFNVADGAAWHHWMAGDFHTAEEIYVKQLARLNANYKESGIHHNFRHRLAYIWLQKGKDKEAIQLLEENIKQLMVSLESGSQGGVAGDHYDIAGSYLMLGEKELAYEWLEKMPHDLFISMLIKVDPMFTTLKGEPRFQIILDRVYAEEQKIQNMIRELELEQELRNVLGM